MGLLTDGYGVTGVEVAKNDNGNAVAMSSVYRLVKNSTQNVNRTTAIVPGRFYVDLADGSVDGAVEADFTFGATRKIRGLCARCMNDVGGSLDNPYIAVTSSGLVQGYEDLANLVFRGWLDAAVAATNVGSVAIDDVAVMDAVNTDTFTPEAYAPDRLKGSTYNASSTQHACALAGLDPDTKNRNANALVVLFKINAGFRASGA